MALRPPKNPIADKSGVVTPEWLDWLQSRDAPLTGTPGSPPPSAPPPGASGEGITIVNNYGQGTPGSITKWLAPQGLGDSIITESGPSVSVAGHVTAVTFTGSGAGLTDLNVAQSIHHWSHETGGNDEITNINATHLTSGTVPVARLDPSVAIKPLPPTDLVLPNDPVKFLDGTGAWTVPVGGADLEYSGDYTPGTYSDGDIVVAADGVAYLCVKDGVTTPPEPWPGVGLISGLVGPEGPPGPEGPMGPIGPRGPVGPAHAGTIGIVLGGGSSVITAGVKGFYEVAVPCTITGVTLLSTDAAVTAGSIVVDIWKSTYDTYPPSAANSIVAAARPTLTNAQKSRDTTLSGWTTTITPGDILAFSVVSASAVTKVSLSLTVQL